MVEVSLGEPVPGAVVSLDERLLGLTDKNGLLFLDFNLPADAEVRVTLPVMADASQNELVVSTNLLTPKRALTVNVPHHLMTALLKNNPGMTHAQGEQRIRQFLAIKQPWSLVGLEDSGQSPFSAKTFLYEAGKQGGVAAFTNQLVQEESAGKTHAFLSGAAFGDGESSIFGDIFQFAAISTASGIEHEIIGWLTRILAHALGIKSGTQQILAELSNLQNILEQQFNELEQDQVYLSLKSSLVDPITSDTTNFYNDAEAVPKQSPPFSMYGLGSGVSQMISDIDQTDYWQAITSMFDSLIGASSVVVAPSNSPGIALRPERLIAKDIYPKVGIDSDLSTYAGYGAFNNTTLQAVMGWQDYYKRFGVLACNLLAENAHSTVDGGGGQGSGNLAEAIRELQLQLVGTTQLGFAPLSKAVDQLTPPKLPSDQVFIDRENGLMWFMVAKGDLTMDQAKQFASSLVAGPYKSGWRVPWIFELESLYARINGGWSNLTNAERKGKKESSVLTRLGFDISAMSDTHHVWANRPYLAGGGGPGYFEHYRFSLDTGNYDGFGSHHDLLLVRSYSEAQQDWYFSDAELTPDPKGVMQIESVLGASGQAQLKALLTMGAGIGGDFTINGKTVKPKYLIGQYPDYSYQALSAGFAPYSTVTNKDITSQVVWTSSDDDQAFISNMPGKEGTVYWRNSVLGYAPKPVTFTAYFQDKKAEIILNPPTDVVWGIDSISMTPYDAGLEMNGASSMDINYFATLFMKNPANGDRTALRSSYVDGDAAAPVVTWTVTDKDGNPIPADQARFSNPKASVLHVTSALQANPLKITATSGGVSTSSMLYVTH